MIALPRASQPAAKMSASAVFPDPLAPTTAIKPGFRAKDGVLSQGALVISTWEITSEAFP
ncbi:hypothetical protein PSPTOT1_5430 [Pseudomonas syringae pv. tomato T1]|nr:hypothetical protein PSPTOT1_5430 [Pseudomonas syringae pv. tomato T1]